MVIKLGQKNKIDDLKVIVENLEEQEVSAIHLHMSQTDLKVMFSYSARYRRSAGDQSKRMISTPSFTTFSKDSQTRRSPRISDTTSCHLCS